MENAKTPKCYSRRRRRTSAWHETPKARLLISVRPAIAPDELLCHGRALAPRPSRESHRRETIETVGLSRLVDICSLQAAPRSLAGGGSVSLYSTPPAGAEMAPLFRRRCSGGSTDLSTGYSARAWRMHFDVLNKPRASTVLSCGGFPDALAVGMRLARLEMGTLEDGQLATLRCPEAFNAQCMLF